MELSTKRQEFECFKLIYQKELRKEETKELVVPDICGDIKEILDTRGQIFLNSKSVSNGKIVINARAEISLIYLEEKEGKIESLNTSMDFELNDLWVETLSNPNITLNLSLSRCDSRSLNPRKILLRLEACCKASCYVKELETIPVDLSSKVKDIYIKKENIHLKSIESIGEKVFSQSEEYGLNEYFENPKLASCTSNVYISDCKSLKEKLVFKGKIISEALFIQDDSSIKQMVWESEFSQLMELEGLEEGDEVLCSVCLKNAEFEKISGREYPAFSGIFQLEVQGICLKNKNIPYIADAYGNYCELEIEKNMAEFFDIKDIKTLSFQLENDNQGTQTKKDLLCLNVQELSLELQGNKILGKALVNGVYADEENVPCSTKIRLSGETALEVKDGENINICGSTFELTKNTLGQLCLDGHIKYYCYMVEEIEYVESLTLIDGSYAPSNDLANLYVLWGGLGIELWDLAKKYSSSTELIEKYNEENGKFDVNKRPLLIPRS